jgi:glutamate synthase (NADPH/NADH) small chain
MGKETGFLELDRRTRTYPTPKERLKHYKEFVVPLPGTMLKAAGRALHELRHSVLSQRLPGEQPDPGLEPPGLRRRLAGRARSAAFDQQLPRIHRPHLPRPVRGELHAEHRRPAGDDQDDRMRDRRQGLGRRLDQPQVPAARTGKSRRGRRLRPGGLACAQQLARAGHA